MTHFCSVIVIRNGVVDENVMFVDTDNTAVGIAADMAFADFVKRYADKPHTDEEIQLMLDEGFVELTSATICISWPDIREVAESGDRNTSMAT